MNANNLHETTADVKNASTDPVDLALSDLCQHGEHTRDGITYTLTVSGPHGRQQYEGHRFANEGNAYYKAPLLGTLLAWLVKPLGTLLVDDVSIRELDGLYARADCPFGCRVAERTCSLKTQDTNRDGHAYRRIEADYHWHACQHFRGEVKEARRAVFAVDRDCVRTCWSCDAWTPEDDDVCAHCGESAGNDPSRDPIHEPGEEREDGDSVTLENLPAVIDPSEYLRENGIMGDDNFWK